MDYTLGDYLFSIIFTIAIYDTVPVIISCRLRTLKLWHIRTISIANYILGYAFFYVMKLSFGGTASAGAAFIWTLVGYELMKKFSLQSDIPEEKHSDSDKLLKKRHHVKRPGAHQTVPIFKTVAVSFTILFLLYSIGATICIVNQKVQLSELSVQYEMLQTDYDTLQEAYDALSVDYKNKQSAYSKVYAKYRKILSQYDMLKPAYEELSALYNSKHPDEPFYSGYDILQDYKASKK